MKAIIKGHKECTYSQQGRLTVVQTPNGQIFESHNSRKNFVHDVRMVLSDNSATWDDDDASLWLKMKDGSEIFLQHGDMIPKINMNNVAQGIYSNPATRMIYNVGIVKNERYDDYDTMEA